MLHVGAVVGGPEHDSGTRFDQLFRSIKAVVARTRDADPLPEEVSLDIVLHVPGSLYKPQFAGCRTGSFFRKRLTLQVQIAIPEALIDATGGRDQVLSMIRDGIRIGSEELRRRGLNAPEKEWSKIIDEAMTRASDKAM